MSEESAPLVTSFTNTERIRHIVPAKRSPCPENEKSIKKRSNSPKRTIRVRKKVISLYYSIYLCI